MPRSSTRDLLPLAVAYLPVPIGGLITALFVIERLWVSNLFEQPSDDAISQISTE